MENITSTSSNLTTEKTFNGTVWRPSNLDLNEDTAFEVAQKNNISINLSKHLKTFKKNVIGEFVLTYMGDNRTFSYLPSRYGNTLSGRIAKNVLKHLYPHYESYSFLERGSDERQYCKAQALMPCRSDTRFISARFQKMHGWDFCVKN